MPQDILSRSVLSTLTFYTAWETPLTLPQLGRYLMAPTLAREPLLSEIKPILDNLIKNGKVACQKGLYSLNSHFLKQITSLEPRASSLEPSWLRFIQSEKAAQMKINIVRRALRLISFLPFIKGLFLCGSVARKVSRAQSDIDFLILTEKSRVWTVRFLLTLLVFLTGKKTHDGRSRKNRFCLNHYRSGARLKLERELRDPYSAQEYARMINIYSKNSWNIACYVPTENEFYEANQDWMRKFLPNFDFIKPAIHAHGRNIACCVPTVFGNWLEKILRNLQTVKITRSRQKFAALDKTRIIADNEVIMFHLNPRAPLIMKKYNILCRRFKC